MDSITTSIFNVVLEEIKREDAPVLWASAQLNLGNALFELGKRTKRNVDLKSAAKAYEFAIGAFEAAEVWQYQQYCNRQLILVNQLLTA